MKNIAVIGFGSWGLALSTLLAGKGHNVTVWGRNKEKVEAVRTTRLTDEYLPGIRIDDSINITNDLKEAVNGAEILVCSIASQALRSVLAQIAPFYNGQIVVSTAKGIEDNTLLLQSQVIEEMLPSSRVVALSGPSHAEEVARKLPTTCVVASHDPEVAHLIQDVFITPVFRVYTNNDILGVQLGGALKNVISLAAGISDGMGYGDNIKAALMTRGIVEITRLGVAMGAQEKTFSGLSGIGDLIVTCTSQHSRNRRAGFLLGQGKSLEEALEEVHMVVEGVTTARAAAGLSERYGVDMPITYEVNQTLFGGKNPRQAVTDLMTRDRTTEV